EQAVSRRSVWNHPDPFAHADPTPVKDRDQKPLFASVVFHQLRFAGAGFAGDRNGAGIFVSVLGKQLFGRQQNTVMRGQRLIRFRCHVSKLQFHGELESSNTSKPEVLRAEDGDRRTILHPPKAKRTKRFTHSIPTPAGRGSKKVCPPQRAGRISFLSKSTTAN